MKMKRVPCRTCASKFLLIQRQLNRKKGDRAWWGYDILWLYDYMNVMKWQGHACSLLPCSVVFASNRSWNDRFWERGNMNFSRSKPSRYARTSIWGDAASGCSCIVWDRVTKEEDVKMDQDASDDFDGSYISQLKNFNQPTYKKTIHSSSSS